MRIDEKRVRRAVKERGAGKRDFFSKFVGFVIFAALIGGTIALFCTFFSEGKKTLERIAARGQDEFLESKKAAENAVENFKEATAEDVQIILNRAK